MISITRKFGFDAGHRVLGHEGKCRHLHGHRYTAEVTVTALGLDALSRVVDFGEVKQLIGEWIDNNWDHNLILNSADPILTRLSQSDQEAILQGRVPYILAHGQNPTAEVLAEVLGRRAGTLLYGGGLTVIGVRLWETPNCYADWTANGV